MSNPRIFKARHYMDGPNDIQTLTESELMQWGLDDAQNHGYDAPKTPEEAMNILNDIGDVEVREKVQGE